MKTSTRIFFALTLLLAQLSAAAATFTVQVSDTQYSPQTLTIRPGDVVSFQWVSGVHPTVSDSNPAAFPAFLPSAANPTTNITFNSVGQFDYHCTAHGVPQGGMWGRINVSNVTPTQEARQAATLLGVYPNPVRGGQATVQVSNEVKLSNATTLRITNIIGREVRRVTLLPESLVRGQQVDMSTLPAGIYFCSLVVSDKVISTKRVTVQN